MKIPATVRRIFDAQHQLNSALQVDVDRTIRQLKDNRWHFESRLKEIQSFLVKLETGRVAQPHQLEDFLACTIVVPTTQDIKEAYARVLTKFDVRYRRPKVDGETTKAANAFPFDDLRLYLVRKEDDTVPEKAYDKVVFEMQIKTFLQHAWGIATHDFNYKSDEISWSKDRVVANLKATIEHVELSLHEAKSLAASSLVALTDERTSRSKKIIDVLKANWARDDLPPNLRGLADALEPILAGLKLPPNDLSDMLEAERARGGGSLSLNLSPYGTIVQLLLAKRGPDLDTLLQDSRSRIVLLITPEIELPPGFPSAGAERRIVNVI